MIYSSPKNYYIQQGALQFTLNALDDPDKISIAVASSAAIIAYAKDGNTPIIDYAPSLNYRQWRLTASPTHFEQTDKVYVYVRLSKTTDEAMLIFPYGKLPIDPSASDSSSSDDGNDIASNYYYIMLGALTPSVIDNEQVDRAWCDGDEAFSYGELDTAKQRDEEESSALQRMFQLDSNDVIWAQHDLTFVAGAKLRLLRMATLTGNTTVDVTTITRSSDIASASFDGSNASIPTTAAMVEYWNLREGLLDSKYLRKDQPDTTPYKLTMGEAEVTGDLSVGDDAIIIGDLAVGGDTSLGGKLDVAEDITIGDNSGHGDIKSKSYIFSSDWAGQGWKIDQWGNADLESARIRSFLEVVELLINRLQAQEGDTIFTDNDQIETVTPECSAVTPAGTENPKSLNWYELEDSEYVLTEDTTVVSGKTYYAADSYVLSLKEKWEGYFTSMMKGDIVKGIINTLAATAARISDYGSASVEHDGENKYYTSWMQVVDTRNTDSNLDTNQIRVTIYGNDYDDPTTGERVHITPAGINFPPCDLMNIARWGCWQNPYDQGISPSEKDRRIKRQQMFYISASDGRITKLTGVNAPILQQGNYGTTLGTLPEFVKEWGGVANRLIDGRDYLYAQGVVVGDFIKVDINGLPAVQYVDCGEWIDGSTPGTTVDEHGNIINTPAVGKGIYLCNEKNTTSLQWETHDVWRFGKRWRCKMHQPVVNGSGVATYYPPKFRSPYWDFVEGDSNFSMDFSFTNGDTFAEDSVDTTIIPKLFCGAEDITDEPSLTWSWKRSSDKRTADTIAADEAWNAQHTNVKNLVLTNDDMPIWWDDDNRIRFQCIVSIPDGNSLVFDL